MLIKHIYYPVRCLGPGERVGIWTVGCSHRCAGCVSQNLWDFDESKRVDVASIIRQIAEYRARNADLGITVSGGDPFLQEDLPELLQRIDGLGIEDVLVYTGFTLEELLQKFPAFEERYAKYIGVLIDGRYVEKLNDNKPLRGSANQRIIFLKQSLVPRYQKALVGERKFQFEITKDGKMNVYGVPPKGFLEYISKECLKKGVIYSPAQTKF